MDSSHRNRVIVVFSKFQRTRCSTLLASRCKAQGLRRRGGAGRSDQIPLETGWNSKGPQPLGWENVRGNDGSL